MSRQRLPGGDDADRQIDDPAIAELLDTVREARTSLAIELSAAAGALEAGRPEVARDIVAATSEEMRRVSAPAAPTPTPPRRRRRLVLTLPAIPLVGAVAMTAAAAISGSSNHQSTPPPRVAAVHHVVHVTVPQPTNASAAPDAATTALHRLEHVVTQHPQAAQVLAVADDLHDQLTAMIATAIHDPARLHVVRHLLMLEQHVLETSKVPGTQLALAASRAIARLLELAPSSTSEHALSPSTRPTTAVTTSPTASTSTRPTHAPARVQRRSPQPTSTSNSSGTSRKNALLGGGLFNRP